MIDETRKIGKPLVNFLLIYIKVVVRMLAER